MSKLHLEDINMDLLKRELVKHKIPYHSYDSSTLAKLLLSNMNGVEFNYKIKDSLFHGYIPSSNRFINIIFLEYGYNFISYFKDDFIYLNEVSNYFKRYLVENNLEKELDIFNLNQELRRIEAILSFYENKEIIARYDIYLYFYLEKSELMNYFLAYINNYIEKHMHTRLACKIHPIRDLLNAIEDRSILDKLEYYDLFKNDLTYEKIFNSSIKNLNLSKEFLMKHYSISDRSANILFHEYEIYNTISLQDEEIKKLLISNLHKNNLEIIEEEYIRAINLYSSKVLSLTISQRFKKILYNLLLNYINEGVYLNQIPNLLSKENPFQFEHSITSFCEYLNAIKKNKIDMDEVIYKFIDEITLEKNCIGILLYPLKHFLKQ